MGREPLHGETDTFSMVMLKEEKKHLRVVAAMYGVNASEFAREAIKIHIREIESGKRKVGDE